MNTMPILFMHKEAEKIARSRARIPPRIRGTDEHLLRFIRKRIEEERATARKYRRQIRRCLHNSRIIVRIYLDNTLVSNLHYYLSKLCEVWNDLVDLNRSLGLDRLGHFLRIHRNAILLRQPLCQSLELRQFSIQILETLLFQLARRLRIIPETLQCLRI